MQSLAHRHGEIVVDGFAHEVVAEGETVTGLGEQARVHGCGERREQLRRGAAGDERQLGHGERRAQDRGDPQQVQSVLREQAQPPKERQAQGGWQGRLAGLGPPVPPVDGPLVVERPHQLDHEERVSPGALHLLEQSRADRKTGDLAGEISRLLGTQRPEDHVLGAPCDQVSDDPVNVDALGSLTYRREQRERQTAQVPGDGVHGTQGQRVSPLQVLNDKCDRAGRGEVFEETHDGLDDQPSLVDHPRHWHHPFRRARTDPQQPGDLGALRIGCSPLDL